MSSASSAPTYTVHRTAIAAIDTVANVTRRQGISMSGFEKAHIQVLPSTVSASPSVAVYWWSAEGSIWVREHTAITKATLGAGIAYEFTVDCQHRIMFVAVTGIVADAVTILVAGVPANIG